MNNQKKETPVWQIGHNGKQELNISVVQNHAISLSDFNNIYASRGWYASTSPIKQPSYFDITRSCDRSTYFLQAPFAESTTVVMQRSQTNLSCSVVATVGSVSSGVADITSARGGFCCHLVVLFVSERLWQEIMAETSESFVVFSDSGYSRSTKLVKRMIEVQGNINADINHPVLPDWIILLILDVQKPWYSEVNIASYW
jgi:hypothetical protein